MTRDRHSECFALFQRLAAGSPPLRSVQSWGEKNSAALKFWRRGRDSNPRYPSGYAGFQDRCHQPLGHLSGYYSFTTLCHLPREFRRPVLAENVTRISCTESPASRDRRVWSPRNRAPRRQPVLPNIPQPVPVHWLQEDRQLLACISSGTGYNRKPRLSAHAPGM